MEPTMDTSARLEMADTLFGWRPHPSQRIWLLDDARVKVAACGRRWGKTEAAAVDAATFALAAPKSVQMIVAPTYDQSRLIFGTVERLLMDQEVTRQISSVMRTPYPRLSVGEALVMARTADRDGRNLRGHSADRVIVDEAAFVKDAVVEEVIAPMLADRDGRLVMISTPFGKNHFYRAFVQGQEPVPEGAIRRYSSYTFPSWENPHISREYIEFQRGIVTPRQFAVEYEAEFLDDQASVFAWDLIRAAVELGKSAPPSEEPYVVAGIDWARYSDYTAIVIVDAGTLPHRVLALDRFHRLSWEAQVERAVGVLLKWRAAGVLTDQTSVGDPLLEQLRNSAWSRGAGISIEGLPFTNSSKRDIVDNLVVRLSNAELAIPDDEQLVRELQYFECELTPHGNVRMNARPGYTDDVVVALALAEWQAKGRTGAPRFLTSGRTIASAGRQAST